MLRYVRFLKEYRAFCHAFYTYLGYFSSFKVPLNFHCTFRINNSTARTRHVMKAAGLLKTLRRVVHTYMCTHVHDRQRRYIRSRSLRKKWLKLKLREYSIVTAEDEHIFIALATNSIGFTSVNCDFISLILNKTQNISL